MRAPPRACVCACVCVLFDQTLLIKQCHFLKHSPSVLKQRGGEMHIWPETDMEKYD